MARIIRGREIVEDDWQALADDAPPPSGGRAIVPLKRWQEARAALAAGGTAIGVRIPNTADVLQLWPDLGDRPLIAVEFPAFGDGRAFSQARVLRERCGYRGEIRAVGDVLRDQMQFMRRCGIDAMAPRADQDLPACVAALDDFGIPYQGAADQQVSVFQRRARGA